MCCSLMKDWIQIEEYTAQRKRYLEQVAFADSSRASALASACAAPVEQLLHNFMQVDSTSYSVCCDGAGANGPGGQGLVVVAEFSVAASLEPPSRILLLNIQSLPPLQLQQL